ncbi:hypothetical protein JZ751_019193 [Albula glossodonta]|uniref:Protein kinase domain-containing protein n=1 Tax=Albula glossodonta TaxID=121402 RepID=A0A8T2NP38_9TELE|nr:hypothetical protein JZ751_019193 [Albula glossodonta]
MGLPAAAQAALLRFISLNRTMPGSQVRETMRRLGSSSEEDSGTLAAVDQLSCPGVPLRSHSPSPLARPMGTPSNPSTPCNPHPRSVSTSAAPSSSSDSQGGPYIYTDGLSDPFTPSSPRPGRIHGHAATPPITPPSKRRHRLKPPCTPPPPSRKVLHLLPNITLTRSKSHESQLGNRIEEPLLNKCPKKNKLFLNVHINGSGNGCEDSPSRSPLLSARTPGAVQTPTTAPYTLPGTPTLLEEHSGLKILAVSDLPGLPEEHDVRVPKIRRTESVPSDINNPVDRPTEAPQFGTLPKAITKKEHPPVLNQLDSSSNPSSTTSSTPSSPAPFQQSCPPSATPPPNPSPKGHRDNRFHFPDVPGSASLHSDGLQDTLETDHPADEHKSHLAGGEDVEELDEEEEPEEDEDAAEGEEEEEEEEEEGGGAEGKGGSDGECDGDELDDLPSSRGSNWKNPISRKASQTSVYLQEWDIPFEQLDLGELIGKGRWGKGMGYLHAKGIVHKDLKSKNVFHDTNKVVITDFGLFGISGVVQEGRRENELKLPHGWICYLAPEIVRRMRPGNDEDRLPFSNAADVYAFGTIWYELQARDWPITNQPVEATIWQVGSGEGIKKVLAEISLGKEVTEILSACWAYDLRERPTFTQLADMLEKLPKLNRRLSHPGHFWKSAEYVS